jgi:hypothetical protein
LKRQQAPPFALPHQLTDARSRWIRRGIEDSFRLRIANWRQARTSRASITRRRRVVAWLVIACSVAAWLSIAIRFG